MLRTVLCEPACRPPAPRLDLHPTRTQPPLALFCRLGTLVTLAVLFALQLTLANNVPVSSALRHTFGEWVPWIVMAPLIFWMAG